MELGPVSYALLAFPGNQFRGEIVPALADLVDSGLVRIIDLAFVTKDIDGTTATLELGELAPDVRAVLGAAGVEIQGLLNEEDLQSAAEGLEPNSSAALLLWEDLWALPLANAIRGANGVLIERRLIPHEVAQAAHDYALTAAADLLAAENA